MLTLTRWLSFELAVLCALPLACAPVPVNSGMHDFTSHELRPRGA